MSSMEDIDLEEDAVERVLSSDSLSARMARRQSELAQETTEKFPVPGWEDLFLVEFRVLEYTTVRRIAHRNGKIRDETIQELYNMADQLTWATVGFHEVLRGEETRELPDTWESMAKRLPDCPDEITPRRAVLFLVGEKRIHFLHIDWLEWAKTYRPELDQEVARDFVRTR